MHKLWFVHVSHLLFNERIRTYLRKLVQFFPSMTSHAKWLIHECTIWLTVTVLVTIGGHQKFLLPSAHSHFSLHFRKMSLIRYYQRSALFSHLYYRGTPLPALLCLIERAITKPVAIFNEKWSRKHYSLTRSLRILTMFRWEKHTGNLG